MEFLNEFLKQENIMLLKKLFELRNEISKNKELEEIYKNELIKRINENNIFINLNEKNKGVGRYGTR